MANNRLQAKRTGQSQSIADNPIVQQQPIQKMDDPSKEKYVAPKGRRLDPQEEKEALMIDSDLSYQLYVWLRDSDFSNITFTNMGTKGNYLTVCLSEEILLEDSLHPVCMNIHYYTTNAPVLGSIWVGYVLKRKSDLNAQVNPKSYSLLEAWRRQKSAHRSEERNTTLASDSPEASSKKNDSGLKETELFVEAIEIVEVLDIDQEAEIFQRQTDKIMKLILKIYKYAAGAKNKALIIEIERQRDTIGTQIKYIQKALASANDKKFKTMVIKNASKIFEEQLADLIYLDEIKDKYYDNISKPHW